MEKPRMLHSRCLTLFTVSALFGLAGCAGVTIQPLNADGTKSDGEPGVRYYRPEPYLLVTALPPTPASPQAPIVPPAPVDIPRHPNSNSDKPVTPPVNPPRVEPPVPWTGPNVNGPGGVTGDGS